MPENDLYNVIVTPQYGKQWKGIVYREYNNGQVLIVHPVNNDDLTVTIKVDSNICKRITANQ